MRHGGRRGFTLVELLVVVGIIGVLIGILLPALNKARAASQEAVCLSNMHQLGLGFVMYCDASHGLIPQKGPDGSDPAGNFIGVPPGSPPNTSPNGVTGLDDPSLWFNAVTSAMGRKSYYELLVDDQVGNAPAPTSGKSSAFVCPAAAAAGGRGDTLSTDGQYYLLYGAGSDGRLKPITSPIGPSFKFNLSYVVNSSLTNTIANTQTFTTSRLSRLVPAGTVVLMVEKLVNPGEFLDAGVQRYVAAFAAGGGGSYWSSLVSPQGFTSNVAQPKANWKRFAARHNGGGNLLFADGHAAFFKWADAQYPLGQLPFQVKASNGTGSDFNQPSRIIWSIAGPIQ